MYEKDKRRTGSDKGQGQGEAGKGKRATGSKEMMQLERNDPAPKSNVVWIAVAVLLTAALYLAIKYLV